MSPILIRADASLAIGSGHVMRCRTLARELKRRGTAIFFVCRRQPGDLIGLLDQEFTPCRSCRWQPRRRQRESHCRAKISMAPAGLQPGGGRRRLPPGPGRHPERQLAGAGPLRPGCQLGNPAARRPVRRCRPPVAGDRRSGRSAAGSKLLRGRHRDPLCGPGA